MGSTSRWPLACPVCGEALAEQDGTLQCFAGHSFDIARKGYGNLLPPQHRARGIDGDLPSMLQARRRFLEAGHYQPLMARLAADVEELLRDRETARAVSELGPCVLEVGCGEGYYLGNLAEKIGPAADPRTVFIGTDLSKSAVKLAAKRYPLCTFFVADVHRRIYLQDQTVSVLLDVFAPRNPGEFARVLEPGGSALIVIPSAKHLASARAELGLLGIEEDKERRVLERFGEAFELRDRAELSYPIELLAESASDVVSMGPSHWHRAQEAAGAIAEPITTEASFVILRLGRR
jgi:23S rRNA (guanine745-N1)-methyltransferase